MGIVVSLPLLPEVQPAMLSELNTIETIVRRMKTRTQYKPARELSGRTNCFLTGPYR
jgi:hypothetical protein